MAKTSYQKQFKRGTMPDQPVDPHRVINDPKQSSPSSQRKRQGVAPGFDQEARPGLAGISDDSRKRRK